MLLSTLRASFLGNFLMKHNERTINDGIIRYIKALFEQEEEVCYEHKRVSNFWDNNYIE